MAHPDLLLKPVAVSVPASSCRSPLRSAALRSAACCDRPRLGPPRLALYSLTESACTPFHPEPTQKYELVARDEVGYVPLADIGAEFLFQVISERAERAAIIVTTNLPFSEWTTVFPNPRLCKALLDRITDRAHIIEAGTESFRFRRTMERRKKH